MALTLESLRSQGALPQEMADEVFKRVTETSVIGQVAGRTDMTMNGGKYLIDAGVIEADIVEEGKPKPVSDLALGYVEAIPLKAAVIVPWTREARLANPAGIFDRLQAKLVEAINQQIDAAAIYGKSVKSKKDIPNVAYLNQSTNRVKLGTNAKNKGGLRADVLQGYDAVQDSGHDFASFIADPRARSIFASATDTAGRPLFDSGNTLGNTATNILGLPAAFGKAVSGRYGNNNPDTGVRMIGGDFANNLKFGFIDNITVRMTDQATIGGVSMFETNQEAALVEAIFSYVIRDVDAFAVYEAEKASAGGSNGGSNGGSTGGADTEEPAA